MSNVRFEVLKDWTSNHNAGETNFRNLKDWVKKHQSADDSDSDVSSQCGSRNIAAL